MRSSPRWTRSALAAGAAACRWAGAGRSRSALAPARPLPSGRGWRRHGGMKRFLLLALLALPLWAGGAATNLTARATLRELRKVEAQMVRRNRALMQADRQHRQVPNPDWRPGDDPALALIWAPGPVAAGRNCGPRCCPSRRPRWLKPMSPPPRLFRPMNASRILAALLALATLALVAWLHRWSVTPLAWDRRDAWRAVRLDRWTGRAG